jgi:hypothetical protein
VRGASITKRQKENEMNRQGIFPSRFFRTADLPEPLNLKIKSAEMEILKSPQGLSEKKLVLGFDSHPKLLACNITNYDSIAAIHGDDTDAWIGATIQLHKSVTFVRGKQTDCVRVRRAG